MDMVHGYKAFLVGEMSNFSYLVIMGMPTCPHCIRVSQALPTIMSTLRSQFKDLVIIYTNVSREGFAEKKIPQHFRSYIPDYLPSAMLIDGNLWVAARRDMENVSKGHRPMDILPMADGNLEVFGLLMHKGRLLRNERRELIRDEKNPGVILDRDGNIGKLVQFVQKFRIRRSLPPRDLSHLIGQEKDNTHKAKREENTMPGFVTIP